MIKCHICGKKLRWVNDSHLKIHGLDISTYKSLFPDLETIEDEVRNKISESLKGRTFTEEHCQKLSKARERFVFTEKHRRKASESHKGRHHTEETKQKISIGNKGKHKGIVAWNKGLTKETDVRVKKYGET